jgi:hypothetical protein
MQLGMTYERADGATFIPWAAGESMYVGEITTDRGPRRHVVDVDDHDEWKLKGNERGASEDFAVLGPVEVTPHAKTDEEILADAEVAHAEATKGERKVKHKK